MALRGTATTFRDGCQRWYLGLQKPRDWGKGEWREWIFFCFFREFAGFFEFFFLTLFNMMWHLKT
jgi:hypothetical protein